MVRRYLRFWGPRADADVDDELQFHLDMRVQDHMARGLSETEARDAVRRRLGDLGAVRAACLTINTRRNRRMARAQTLDAFLQDVRFGVRSMLRQKGWTAVGVLTLALGIGANTAMFSVVNGMLLHPLDYPHAGRLAVVYQKPATGDVSGVSVYVLPPTRVLRAWRAGSHDFEDLEGFSTADAILRDRGNPMTAHTAAVEPGFAAFTGQRPLRGRYFTRADVESKAEVAVLSEGLWRSRYGGADGVLGAPVTLGRTTYTIIGIMPEAFQLPALLQDRTDVFTPLDVNDDRIGVSIVGRLRPGVTTAAAARELDTLAAHAAGGANASDYRTTVVSPGKIVRYGDSLLLLSGAVALVLIIACANVAHLLLARGSSRQHELAIRAAIGAGRWRIARQILTESLLLAAAGCVLGVAAGWAGLRALVALRPSSLSQLAVAHLEGRAVLVAVVLAVATGLAFGVIGALQSARLMSPESLRLGASAAQGASRARSRSILVVTEMALCTTLLVAATLLIRSVAHLQLTDPGFEPAGLYAVSPDLSATNDTTPALRWSLVDRLAERVRALPGVSGVTVATNAPPGSEFSIGALQVEGQPTPPKNASSFINTYGVRPEFFSVVGIRFVEGAAFTDTTVAGAQVVINEGMARKYWPGTSALGHKLRIVFQGDGKWLTIVGVVNDAATGGLLTERSDPMLYMPPARFFNPALLVRAPNPGAVLPAIRTIVRGMDAAIPPVKVDNVAESMRNTVGGRRFTMLLLASFTALALLLAAVGLYGVMAYVVAQRTRELGVRIALGATAGNIARSVLGRGVALAAGGMVLGLVGAHWATRLMAGMLSGVSADDPTSLMVAAAVLLATAVVACLVPMRRAVRVDPIIAMKSE